MVLPNPPTARQSDTPKTAPAKPGGIFLRKGEQSGSGRV